MRTARRPHPMFSPHLSTLDLVCLLMDSGQRPLDFAVLLHFDRELDADALALGARSARKLYPVTGCRVVGGRWAPLAAEQHEPEIPVVRDAADSSQLRRFVGLPFDVTDRAPLRQLWVSDGRSTGGCLVTRIHHCAADLLSGLQWIRHQLRVAAGRERPCAEPFPLEAPELAESPSGAKRNPGWQRCGPVWTRPAEPTGERRWTTFSIPIGPLADLSTGMHGFTFNDVLAVAVLETLQEWNRTHGEAERKVGIWLPVNIRRDPFVGFGNGSSRIRVRRDYPSELRFGLKCRAVRQQVARARKRGEWVVPQRTLLTRLPLRLSAPVIRRYLNRPWADMGSAAFSHVQRWPGQQDFASVGLQELEIIGAMHRRHSLMFAAVTCLDRTWITITYDPALLRSDDISSIRDRYLRIVAAATREIACAPS